MPSLRWRPRHGGRLPACPGLLRHRPRDRTLPRARRGEVVASAPASSCRCTSSAIRPTRRPSEAIGAAAPSCTTPRGFGALRRTCRRRRSRPGLQHSPTKLSPRAKAGSWRPATTSSRLPAHGPPYATPATTTRLAGFRARLPEASALLGLAGLDLLEGEARRRNALAAVYRRALGVQARRSSASGGRPLLLQGLLDAHRTPPGRPAPR
jgi:hypothetical protein